MPDPFPTTLVTPASYSKPTSSGNPINDAVKQAQPGAVLLLSPGYFHRCGPFPSSRPVGTTPVSVVGSGQDVTVVLRDTSVGSTDAIYLGPGDHDTSWRNLSVQADDRAGIKTVTGVGPNHSFDHLTISGFGWPCDPAGWNDDSKWGIHCYDTAGWTETNCNLWSIFHEHLHYFHNIKGDHLFEDMSCCFAGRTAWQFVNRMSEGAEGKGSITIRRAYVKDVCLEQGGGGSALTFAGGMPTTDILLDQVTVQLGCDHALQAPFNQNITGSLVVSNPQESAPGKGDGAWPGGIHMLVAQHCSFEVGTVYQGQGSALRANVKLDCPAVGYYFNDCAILTTRGEGANAVALEVTEQAGPVHFTAMRTVTGGVKYRGEPAFKTWADFQAAHPECFA